MKRRRFVNRHFSGGMRVFAAAVMLAAMLHFAAPPPVARAGTLTVTTIVDELDNTGTSTGCSLREAIMEANAAAPGTYPECGAATGGGPDIINLQAATIYTLTLAGAGEDANATGDLDITGDTTINGNGSTVSANNIDRVVHVVTPGVTVVMNDLAIHGGDAGAGDGGGIYNNGGTVTLDTSIILENAAQNGGAIYNGTNGTVNIIDNSVVVTNRAAGDGGGIYNSAGATLLTITDSAITESIAGEDGTGNGSGDGGGIWNDSAANPVVITRSTVNAGLALDQDATGTLGNGGCIYNGTNGGMQITESQINNCGADIDGGCIWNDGELEISRSTINNGVALGMGGGGIANDINGEVMVELSSITENEAANGGGVGNAGLFALDRTEITNNTSWYEGGGIANLGFMIVSECNVEDNMAGNDGMGGGSGNGGGAYNEGELTVLSSYFITNRAEDNAGVGGVGSGGGIYNFGGGLLIVTDSEFVSNVADAGDGGGVFNDSIAAILTSSFIDNVAEYYGGGVYNSMTLEMENCTISNGNRTRVNDGGGLASGWTLGASASLLNVTIASNQSADTGDNIFRDIGTIEIQNTIVVYPATAGNGCVGGITSLGNNIDDDGSCNLTQPTDQPNTNPNLGPMQDNGGPTWTRALPTGSNAIDRGNDGACPPTDQRGVARPQDGDGTVNCIATCDIGAYEAPTIPCKASSGGGDDDDEEPTPTPVPPPAAHEFNCWPWLIIEPPPTKSADGYCQASLGEPIPEGSTFRYLGHSTDVVVKDASGNPIKDFGDNPLNVCFRYTEPELDALGGSPGDFLLQVYRDGVWEPLDTYVEGPAPGEDAAGRICADVDHLTLFALFAYDGEPIETPPEEKKEEEWEEYPLLLPETGGATAPWLIAGGLMALSVGAWMARRRVT